MSLDMEYIGLGGLNVKITISKMTLIVGRRFSHRLLGIIGGRTDRCTKEDEFSLRCYSDLEKEHLGGIRYVVFSLSVEGVSN